MPNSILGRLFFIVLIYVAKSLLKFSGYDASGWKSNINIFSLTHLCNLQNNICLVFLKYVWYINQFYYKTLYWYHFSQLININTFSQFFSKFFSNNIKIVYVLLLNILIVNVHSWFSVDVTQTIFSNRN